MNDLSGYTDEALTALLDDVQAGMVARNIEGTAALAAGTYVGGRDIPVGSYILTTAGTEDDRGFASLGAADDPEDDYPAKFHEYLHGDDVFSLFLYIGEGDTLFLPFRFTLTISAGVVFR